jgi:hypothetical protein
MSKQSASSRNWTPEEIIDRFLERVEEFESTRLLRNGFSVSFKISWDEDKGLSAEVTPVDDDDLRSFLAVFRHFVSDNEPMFLYKVFNTCQQYLNNDALKTELIEIRKLWGNALKKNGIELAIDGSEYTPEDLMRTWLNGWSHHNDDEFRNLVKEAPSKIQATIVKGYMLDALVEASKVITVTGEAVSAARKNGWFTF